MAEPYTFNVEIRVRLSVGSQMLCIINNIICFVDNIQQINGGLV